MVNVQLEHADKISSQPVVCGNGVQVCSPKWKSIEQIGYKTYLSYLNTISLDFGKLSEIINKEDAGNQTNQYHIYDYIALYPNLKTKFEDAISFFLTSQVIFDVKKCVFVIHVPSSEFIIQVTKQEYQDIVNTICQLNNIHVKHTTSQLKYRNKAAKAIYDKIQQNRDKNEVKDKMPDLPEVVSAICARHQSINYINVGELTVMQLYDTFSRMCINHRIDISSLRWAYYGKDPFDYTLWYK